MPSRRIMALSAGGVVLLLLLVLLLVATFPASWAKSWAERTLTAKLGAPVTIGSLSRTPALSFTPTLVVHDMRVAQPRWAGEGALLSIAALRLRMPLLPALIGRDLQPDSIAAQGLSIALVRDADGRSNWQGRGESARSDKAGGGGLRLTSLTIADGRFSLRDARRHLSLTGTLAANAATGLVVKGEGRFHDARATLSLTGEPIAARDRARPYPFTLTFASPLLDLTARGETQGALNMAAMNADVQARGQSLKYLDDLIQAGLFGTQKIDLAAHVRHRGRDWFIDRIGGSIGRSRFTGKAEILKREGRSKIDADLNFPQFDFDDLADDAGLAEAAALTARIGPRVLPNTRINLAKIGPTDGQIRFNAGQLLFRQPSVFRSLSGVIRFDGEAIALTISGAARDPSGLRLADPIRVGGTLSHPALQIADIDGDKPDVGSVLGAVAKSVGGALGLRKQDPPPAAAPAPADCAALSRQVLRDRP